MESFVAFTKSQERIITHASLKATLLLDRPSTYLDVGTVISCFRSIATARIACDAAIVTSFRQAAQHTAELSELKPIWDFAQAWDAQAYKDAERSVQQFRADMMMLRCGVCSVLAWRYRMVSKA
jgi:hypothetical protein